MATIPIGKAHTIDTSWDNIVIMNVFETVRGGRSLDVGNITEKVLKAGHLIIVEDATGEHKPMPLTGNSYEAGSYADLPAGHSYKGVLSASILTEKPFAAIVLRGSVNEEAAKNAGLPGTIPAAAKTALSLILFTKD